MRLTLQELLKITATTDQGLRSLRRRGQIALAFGQRHAFDSLTYLPLDAVAMLLRGTLAKSYGQTEAAQFVRIYGDVWAQVVAEAEADFKTDVSFCIVDFERENDGKKATMAAGARDATPEQIAAAVANTPEAQGFVAVRINCVNLSHLIRAIRTSAAKHGINLTMPFMPPPGSEDFQKLFEPYVEARDAAIVQVRDRRRREVLARQAGEKARAAAERLQEQAAVN
jgi:hypothetical protein